MRETGEAGEVEGESQQVQRLHGFSSAFACGMARACVRAFIVTAVKRDAKEEEEEEDGDRSIIVSRRTACSPFHFTVLLVRSLSLSLYISLVDSLELVSLCLRLTRVRMTPTEISAMVLCLSSSRNIRDDGCAEEECSTFGMRVRRSQIYH